MSPLRFVGLALLWAGLCVQTLTAQDARELARKIRKAGDDADPQWVQQLASLRTAKALRQVEDLVDDLDHRSRLWYSCWNALLAFRGHAEVAEDALQFLREAALSAKNPDAGAAMGTLVRWGSEAQPVLLEIAREGRLANNRARALAPLLPTFRDHPDREHLQLLLTVYRSPWSGNTEQFAEALAAFPAELLVPKLMEFLNGRAPSSLQEGAMIALGGLPGDQAEQALRELLTGEDAGLALRALSALAARGAEQHLPEVSKLLRSKDPVLRFRALVEEGRLRAGEPDWEDKITKLAASRDRVDRQAAAACSGRLARDRAWQLLAPLLADPSPQVLAEAVLACQALRLKRSIPAMIEALATADAEGEVVRRDRIVTALADLTGQTFGPAVHTWQLWWQREGAHFVLPDAEEIRQKAAERQRKRSENETAGSFYGLPVVSRRAVFVLDLSGSMGSSAGTTRYGGGTRATRLDVAKEQMRNALVAYPSDALFNLVFFHSNVRPWQDHLVRMGRKSRKAALDFLDRQQLGGATALYDALEQAFRIEGVDTLYVMSDGVPGGGTIDQPELIRKRVAEWNSLSHITIHCVSVGGEIALLRQLAEDSGGRFQVVDADP